MKLLDDMGALWKDREGFFKKKLQEKEGWSDIAKPLVISFAVAMITNFAITTLLGGPFTAVVQAIILLFLLPFAFLAYVLVTHVMVKLLGGKEGFFRTAQALSYGQTFFWLLCWIPLANAFAGMFGFGMGIAGLREMQKLDQVRAAVAGIVGGLASTIVYVAYLLGMRALAAAVGA